MKLPLILFAVLLAGCSQAPSDSDTAPSAEAATSPTEAEHQAMAVDKQPGQVATIAKAEGTVESINAGKITIAHGPVDALKWPAMTMAFNATPEQLASVKAGQNVQFEFTAEGMDATITSIAVAN